MEQYVLDCGEELKEFFAERAVSAHVDAFAGEGYVDVTVEYTEAALHNSEFWKYVNGS